MSVRSNLFECFNRFKATKICAKFGGDMHAFAWKNMIDVVKTK